MEYHWCTQCEFDGVPRDSIRFVSALFESLEAYGIDRSRTAFSRVDVRFEGDDEPYVNLYLINKDHHPSPFLPLSECSKNTPPEEVAKIVADKVAEACALDAIRSL